MRTLATILWAAEEEEASGLDLLLPETSELIGGVIAFAVVFFFVRLWAWPAINRALEQRQQAITGKLESAEETKQEAESLLEDYKLQISDARGQAAQVMEEARAAAETRKSETLAAAEAEAGQIVEKARQEAEEEKNRVMAEARREIGEISLALAEKVVGSGLDREAQQALIDQYLDELERM